VGDRGRNNNAFEGPHPGYIPSYVPDSGRYASLAEAVEAAKGFEHVGGITEEPGGGFTLRRGNAPLPSPHPEERSWRHVKQYPGCCQRFRGRHDAGLCVHGVGENQQHYTCCGLTDAGVGWYMEECAGVPCAANWVCFSNESERSLA
jgi:hypothetical protein